MNDLDLVLGAFRRNGRVNRFLLAASVTVTPTSSCRRPGWLDRPLLQVEWFHSIRALVSHTANVEDGWIHDTTLQDTPINGSFPTIKAAGNGPVPVFDRFTGFLWPISPR